MPATHLPTTETTTGTTIGTTNRPLSTTTQQTPSTTEGPQETTEAQTTATTSPTIEPPNTQPTETHTESVASGPVSTENAAPSTPEGSNSSSDSKPSNSDDSTSSSGSPAVYSGDTDDNAEMTGNDASNYPASQVHKSSSAGDKVATPAFHYGLFAAIFAIVALILVVVVGILKEHRFLRFRTRRVGTTQASSEGKTSRETLHSLLGPSKLGFSRLRTYDSDSEVEEFPIFSRVRFCLLSSVYILGKSLRYSHKVFLSAISKQSYKSSYIGRGNPCIIHRTTFPVQNFMHS